MAKFSSFWEKKRRAQQQSSFYFYFYFFKLLLLISGTHPKKDVALNGNQFSILVPKKRISACSFVACCNGEYKCGEPDPKLFIF
jgi:hypothetical protein